MKLKIGNITYNNKAPYENINDIGNDYKLLNKHLMELGYGAFNCNELFEFWDRISAEYCASWLTVPEDLEEFKAIIGYDDDWYENEDNIE